MLSLFFFLKAVIVWKQYINWQCESKLTASTRSLAPESAAHPMLVMLRFCKATDVLIFLLLLSAKATWLVWGMNMFWLKIPVLWPQTQLESLSSPRTQYNAYKCWNAAAFSSVAPQRSMNMAAIFAVACQQYQAPVWLSEESQSFTFNDTVSSSLQSTGVV